MGSEIECLAEVPIPNDGRSLADLPVQAFPPATPTGATVFYDIFDVFYDLCGRLLKCPAQVWGHHFGFKFGPPAFQWRQLARSW